MAIHPNAFRIQKRPVNISVSHAKCARPFLWIFALVYIDDIVIFSRSFEEHLGHLDQVFKAVAETGITLATTKCHFAYQSLLLLGQKVSRLGLSTHMEKVSAILNLDEPKKYSRLTDISGNDGVFFFVHPVLRLDSRAFIQLVKKGL